jgi:hypothetical protein
MMMMMLNVMTIIMMTLMMNEQLTRKIPIIMQTIKIICIIYIARHNGQVLAPFFQPQ